MAADWNYLRRFAEDPDFQNPKRLREPIDYATMPDYDPRKQATYAERAQALRVAQGNAARDRQDKLAAEKGKLRAAADARNAEVTANRRKARFLLGAGGALGNWAGNVHDRVARMPSPGGVGVLIVILLAFLFFLVPVQGSYTRARLLWSTLLGHTSIGTTDYGPPEWHPAGGTAASSAAQNTSGSSPVAPPNNAANQNPQPGTWGPTYDFSIPPPVGINGF